MKNFCTLYFSLKIIWVIKSRGDGMGTPCSMHEKMSNTHNIFGGKPEVK
jgi:hypothetical protein